MSVFAIIKLFLLVFCIEHIFAALLVNYLYWLSSLLFNVKY